MSVLKSQTLIGTAFSLLVIGAVLVAPAAMAATDACVLFTAADFQKLGIKGVPKGRTADTPHAAMRGCSAGSMLAPPSISLTIQRIKQPMFVVMASKGMAGSSGEALAGPWEVGKISLGVDGTSVQYLKGNTQVLLHASGTDQVARSVLVDIAKRVAGTL